MEQARAVFKQEGKNPQDKPAAPGICSTGPGIRKTGPASLLIFCAFWLCEAMGKNKMRAVL